MTAMEIRLAKENQALKARLEKALYENIEALKELRDIQVRAMNDECLMCGEPLPHTCSDG